MTTPIKPENIPSKCLDLLDTMKGRKIVRLCRFTCWTLEEQLNFCQERGYGNNVLFSLSEGLLMIELDSGLIVVVASGQPRLNSLVIWVEKNESGEIAEDPLELDQDFLPIEAQDQEYSNSFWSGFINQKISDIEIFKCLPESVMYEDLPNEVGLIIEVESGEKLLLSYQTFEPPFDGDYIILFRA
jgi:hypothetical protein